VLDEAGRPHPAEYWLVKMDIAARWRFQHGCMGYVFEVGLIQPIVEGGGWFAPENLPTHVTLRPEIANPPSNHRIRSTKRLRRV
jgi:hypothetical protein